MCYDFSRCSTPFNVWEKTDSAHTGWIPESADLRPRIRRNDSPVVYCLEKVEEDTSPPPGPTSGARSSVQLCHNVVQHSNLWSTTGHAVGSVLIAIILGPWAAVAAVSLALVVQALVFGDGGVTAIGANCLNMAVVMPFAGWGVYRLIVRRAPAESPRHRLGAAIGGYVGLNVAAVTAALMLGIQPLIAHDAIGRALYNPYGLSVALPAMAAGHLLVFGFVEAAVTGLVVAYVQRTDPHFCRARQVLPGATRLKEPGVRFRHGDCGDGGAHRSDSAGIVSAGEISAGSAWGEWSSAESESESATFPRE